jgi:hypothetical protein
VRDEVCTRHLAGSQKRGRRSKQTNRNQRATDQFDNSRHQKNSMHMHRSVWSWKHAQQLLRTMTPEEKPAHDSQ